MLASAQARADAFAARARRQGRRARRPGLVALMQRARRAPGARRPRRLLRASSTSPIDTADPARGALLQRMQEKATAIETALLFFELEWAALDDDRAEELLATEGLDFARHHLRTARRYRPHLLSRARGEDPLRARADRPHGVDAAVRGAGVRDHRRAARRDRAGLARGRDGAAVLARPRGAPRHRRAGHGRAAARPAHARVRVQHAARGQDGRGPAALATRTGWPAATSPTRPPTSRCRR